MAFLTPKVPGGRAKRVLGIGTRFVKAILSLVVAGCLALVAIRSLAHHADPFTRMRAQGTLETTPQEWQHFLLGIGGLIIIVVMLCWFVLTVFRLLKRGGSWLIRG